MFRMSVYDKNNVLIHESEYEMADAVYDYALNNHFMEYSDYSPAILDPDIHKIVIWDCYEDKLYVEYVNKYPILANDEKYLYELLKDAKYEDFNRLLHGHAYICQKVKLHDVYTIVLEYMGFNAVTFGTLWRVGNMVFDCEHFDFEAMEEVIKSYLDAGNDFYNIRNRNWY